MIFKTFFTRPSGDEVDGVTENGIPYGIKGGFFPFPASPPTAGNWQPPSGWAMANPEVMYLGLSHYAGIENNQLIYTLDRVDGQWILKFLDGREFGFVLGPDENTYWAPRGPDGKFPDPGYRLQLKVHDDTGDYAIEIVSGSSGDDVLHGSGYLNGNDGSDTLNGGAGGDVFKGGAGNDDLAGGAGADILNGGTGHDWLDGGTGADLIDGGEGWDVASYQSATSGITVDLTSNANAGAAAGDKVLNIEVLQGSNYADTLTSVDRGGGSGAQLYGEGGNDTLYGWGGGDYLFGGSGNDWLDGGFGSDVLNGGEGLDSFAFTSALGTGNVDTIQDFAAGDTIALGSAVFAQAGSYNLAGTAFKLGTAATTTAHRIVYDQATGDLFYDADGVGGAAQIKVAVLANHAQLSAANFLIW